MNILQKNIFAIIISILISSCGETETTVAPQISLSYQNNDNLNLNRAQKINFYIKVSEGEYYTIKSANILYTIDNGISTKKIITLNNNLDDYSYHSKEDFDLIVAIKDQDGILQYKLKKSIAIQPGQTFIGLAKVIIKSTSNSESTKKDITIESEVLQIHF